MLSAANPLALEEAGFRFIGGSKISKAPHDLMDHVERHGNAFDYGQTMETTRTIFVGRNARARRVVYQWNVQVYRHDYQAIKAMIDRAEAVAADQPPTKKDRFVEITDADPGCRLDPGRTGSLAGRVVGALRQQHQSRDHCQQAGRGQLPRPLPGRTLLLDDQVRPRRPSDVLPTTRQRSSRPGTAYGSVLGSSASTPRPDCLRWPYR
jgi:hypothetical protein